MTWQSFNQASQGYSGNWLASTSGTNITALMPYGYIADPVADRVKPKTAVEWLRDRVAEITDLAFSDVPA